jgi:SNF2-related domain
LSSSCIEVRCCSVLAVPLQIGGIRFLYDNLIESLERFKTSNGLGCILAHSMGLGKTLQVVSFVDVFLRHTGARTVLIIVPVNTLQNWVNEFNMWLPVGPAAASTSDTNAASGAGGESVSSATDSGICSTVGGGNNGGSVLGGDSINVEGGIGETGNVGSGVTNGTSEHATEEKIIPEIDRELFWPREFKVFVITDNMKNNTVRSKVVGELIFS